MQLVFFIIIMNRMHINIYYDNNYYSVEPLKRHDDDKKFWDRSKD